MAKGYNEAVKLLNGYRQLQTAILNLEEEIAELERECGIVKSVRYDKTPVQGGTSGYEEGVISNLDRRAELQTRLDIARSKEGRIKRALDTLSTTERRILECAYIDFAPGYVYRLVEELHYEKTKIYNLRGFALGKFAAAMGIGILHAEKTRKNL